jgi:hypothetical protein
MAERRPSKTEVGGSIPPAALVFLCKIVSKRTLVLPFFGEHNTTYRYCHKNYASQISKNLPGRELNPGHPRDRRVYLPLYYQELIRIYSFLF